MEFAFVVYAISVIGKLGLLLIGLIVLSFTVLFAHCVHVVDDYNKTFKDDFRMKFLVIPVVLSCLLTFTPSERTMYLMAGAALSQTVVESKIGKEALKIVELKIEEELSKLQNKTKD